MINDQNRKQFELEEVAWESLSIDGKPLPGITYHGIEKADAWCCYWMKMDSNCQSILHRHTDVELISVVKGSVSDSDGKTYHQGDCVVYKKDSSHQLFSKNGCILFVIETSPPALA